MKLIERADVLPPLQRPGLYAGEQGARSHTQWLADAVCVHLNQKLKERRNG